jgi:hypothetical protein
MHFFGFAVSDEAGTSMAAGNRSAIPSDRHGDPPERFPSGWPGEWRVWAMETEERTFATHGFASGSLVGGPHPLERSRLRRHS